MGITDIVLTFGFLFAVEAANHMAQRIQQRELEAEQVQYMRKIELHHYIAHNMNFAER